MATQVLTVRGIEALTPQAKRYEVFDPLTPGLAIRIGPSGRKSFTLVYIDITADSGVSDWDATTTRRGRLEGPDRDYAV